MNDYQIKRDPGTTNGCIKKKKKTEVMVNSIDQKEKTARPSSAQKRNKKGEIPPRFLLSKEKVRKVGRALSEPGFELGTSSV